jgi:hypothetical protein
VPSTSRAARRWALVAGVLMALLHWSISRRSLRTSWGDVHSGASFERARKELIRLEDERFHAKNWRPAILALSGGAGARVRMAAFGNWLCAGRGILSLAQVITGDVEDLVERRMAQERVLRNFIREQGFLAFPAVVVSADRHSGFEALVQCHGLGAFRPNTVLAGWSSDLDHAEEFIDTLRTAARLGQNLLLLSTADGEDPLRVPAGTIDVWWRGKHNGALMLILAHLLVQNEVWRGHSGPDGTRFRVGQTRPTVRQSDNRSSGLSHPEPGSVRTADAGYTHTDAQRRFEFMLPRTPLEKELEIQLSIH